MLREFREQAQKVVPVGNIARLSLWLRVPGSALSLQTGHMTDNDPVPHLRPAKDHQVSSAGQECVSDDL
jgi:hypothetical protein